MPENSSWVVSLIAFILVLALTWVLTRVNHMVFKGLQKKKEGLHLLLFERITSAVILVAGTILAFSVFGGLTSVWKTLLGGTAIASAVLAFAAQDAIKDILAGLMISLYKPFEIGNRVEFEDGTVGIIKDITMRHIVVQGMDSQRVIIPNSKVNAMCVKNYSYHADHRSAPFTFHIAYGSDVEKAMAVIRQAVMDSEYTIPGKETATGPEYNPVYFTAYEDSSLRLTTTVYYEPTVATELLLTDVNLRVYKALEKNGIEIPYPYFNIVQKQ